MKTIKSRPESLIKHIYVDGVLYMYRLHYTDANSLSIKLDRKNEIIVTAGKGMPDFMIDAYLHTNIAKFDNVRNKNLENQIVTNEYLTIKEKKFAIQRLTNVKRKKIEFINNKYYLAYKNQDEFMALIKSIYAEAAKENILPRIKYWVERCKQNPRTIEFKWYIGKWGCCHYHQRKISINSLLVAFSQEIIDYVVIHELMHLVYPNHSPMFWKMVSFYCPNYQHYDKMLNFWSMSIDDVD